MDINKVSIISHKLRPRLSGNFRRSLSWRALPILVVISLLVSMIGLSFPAPALAQHEGEQTAEFLPTDTDLYLTVNLDPSEGQLLKFWTFLNNWWQDPNVQAQWGDMLGQIETESDININEDVFPWLGPEIAMGMRNLGSGFIGSINVDEANSEVAMVENAAIAYYDNNSYTWPAGTNTPVDACLLNPPSPQSPYISAPAKYYDYTFDEYGSVVVTQTEGPANDSLVGGLEWDSDYHCWRQDSTEAPQFTVFVGTMDKNASDDFFFNKLMPAMAEGGEYPTEPSGDYYGIDTLYAPEGGMYFAFAEEYIIFSNNQSFLEGCLDLIVTPNISASMAGTTDFQDAQSALPADRVGMFFFNCGYLWEQIVAQIPSEAQLPFPIEASGDYIPSCFAASLSFGSNGIIPTAYYPLPEGMTLPTTEPDLLRSTKIVPDDALFFISGQDMNASWQQIRALYADNWTDITAGIQESDLPEGMTMEDIATLEAFIAWINGAVGIDIDNDVFGWMTGEYAVAMLSLTSIVEGGPPDQLFMFEVDDTSQVDTSLQAIFNAVGDIAQQDELNRVQEAVTDMMTDNGLATINGVQTPTNDMSAFPDTTTTHGTAGVGWSIYECDVDGDGVPDTSYFWDLTTTWNYTCDNDGTVHLYGPDWTLNTESIDGVEAKVIDSDMWQAIADGASDVLRPGYLFLDVDTAHYLVIGSTTNALEAAVKASKGEIPSLDEAEAYQGLLSMLPETKMSLGYFNVSDILNTILSQEKQSELEQVQDAVTWMMEDNGLTTINGVQTPTNDMMAFPDTTTTHGTAGVGWSIYECDVDGNGVYAPWDPPYSDTSYFWQPTTTWSYTCSNDGIVTQHSNEEIEMKTSVFPLQCALGYSVSLQDSDAVIMSGALYLLPPSLVSQAIPAGTSTVEIPEQAVDFSQLDPDVGQCAISVDVEIIDAPEGANIDITALNELPADILSGFELAATDAGVSIIDIAYGIRVDKTNLTADNIGTATITMKVSKTWADAYGVGNVAIFRVSDGTHEALPTIFKGYDGDYAVFEGTSAGGLSTFGLVAVSIPATALVISDLNISPSSVKTGESVTITAKVANNSGVTASYTASLKIDGTVVDTKQVTLAGGTYEIVSFTVTEDEAGTYTIDVNGLSGSLVVLTPAGFQLSDITVNPGTVEVGENVTITAKVTNTGEATGSYTVSLKLDGVVVDTKEVTLAGGASETVSFTVTKDEPGTYTVGIEGLTGEFTVSAAEAGQTNWALIGGIIGGVIAAAAIATVILLRRRRAVA